MKYPHTLNLYQKPALGSGYLLRLPVYNYRHTIAAVGGFDTASFDIAVRSRDEGQQFLDQYIGNRIAIYVDNPVEPVWEGFINRMTFSAGGVQYTISLDEMANVVVSTYSTSTASPATTESAMVTNPTSQGIYGVKLENVDLGLMVSGTGASIITNAILAQRAYPKASILPGGGNDGLIHIECLGFYHTLSWEGYRDATAASVQLGNLVDTIIGGLNNGDTFFDNTDTSRTVANTNTIDEFHTRGEMAWDVLQKIQEIGNGADRYVIGISPTNFQTGTRVFYYEVASTDVTYTARQSDGLRIRNLYGQLVPPWTVRPDTGIRVSDMLIGWNGVGDNPTETYIAKIDYDANQQQVIYSGDDDISIEGVFNYRRWNKPHGKRNGARRLN